MIEGITVINKIQIITGDTLSNAIMCVSFSVIFIVMGIVLFLKGSDICVPAMFFGICLTILSIFVCSSYINREAYIQYDVLISKSVSYIELTEKYVIDKKNGNIYTIHERIYEK